MVEYFKKYSTIYDFDYLMIAAAKEIGWETVQYVSNIYKYYVAYRLVFANREKKEQLRKKKN